MTLLLAARKFFKRPSEIMCIADSYIGWCFDEAALYLLSKIEETGEIPDIWQAHDNKTAVESMLQRRGVIFNDRRRNDKCQSDS